MTQSCEQCKIAGLLAMFAGQHDTEAIEMIAYMIMSTHQYESQNHTSTKNISFKLSKLYTYNDWQFTKFHSTTIVATHNHDMLSDGTLAIDL